MLISSSDTRQKHGFTRALIPTWKVFDVHTSQVAQGVLVVGGVVPNDAVIFAGEVVKPPMDRRHTWQVVQHLLNFFDDFLDAKEVTILVKADQIHFVLILFFKRYEKIVIFVKSLNIFDSS